MWDSGLADVGFRIRRRSIPDQPNVSQGDWQISLYSWA